MDRQGGNIGHVHNVRVIVGNEECGWRVEQNIAGASLRQGDLVKQEQIGHPPRQRRMERMIIIVLKGLLWR